MKKVFLFTLVMGVFMTFGVFAVFANGESESVTDIWDSISVTGTVSFKDWPHPEITSGRTTYELMVPLHGITDLEVKSGDSITVEGILVDRGTAAESDEPLLMVTKAIIDGEEHEITPHAAWGGRKGLGMAGEGPKGAPRDFGGRFQRGGMSRGRR